jgi:hypothetical protein
MSYSTGYSPVELMYDAPRPDLFTRFLSKSADEVPPTESLQDKVLKAYVRMQHKAAKRKKDARLF